MESLTVILYGKQIDELRQALGHRWSSLDKKAKANESEGIQSDAREKMATLEELMRTCDPQMDIVDQIEPPPESFES